MEPHSYKVTSMGLRISMYLFLIGKPGSYQIKWTRLVYKETVNSLIFTIKAPPPSSGPTEAWTQSGGLFTAGSKGFWGCSNLRNDFCISDLFSEWWLLPLSSLIKDASRSRVPTRATGWQDAGTSQAQSSVCLPLARRNKSSNLQLSTMLTPCGALWIGKNLLEPARFPWSWSPVWRSVGLRNLPFTTLNWLQLILVRWSPLSCFGPTQNCCVGLYVTCCAQGFMGDTLRDDMV